MTTRQPYRRVLWVLIGLLATMAVIVCAEGVRARPPIRPPFKPPIIPRTLYQQEGTPDDGYLAIDASGQGPTGDSLEDSRTNWKYQYGSGSWSGVYSWGGTDAGWREEQSDGDRHWRVEADIELYVAMNLSTNAVTGRRNLAGDGVDGQQLGDTDLTADGLKIYFHIGNVYDARQNPEQNLTAFVTGSLTSNHGMFVGLCFTGTGKGPSSFEMDGGAPTGRVLGAMVGSVDAGGRDTSGEGFDVRFLFSTGSGYRPPDYYGDSPDGTIHDTLWWLVGSEGGTFNLSWEVTLYPEEHQADGNYHLDPVIVVSPTL